MFGFWKRYRQWRRREALFRNVCDYLARYYRPGAKFCLPPAAPDAGKTEPEETSEFKYSLSDYQEPEKSGSAVMQPAAASDAGKMEPEETSEFNYSLSDFQEPEKSGSAVMQPVAATGAGKAGPEEASGVKYSLSDYQRPEKSGSAAEPRMVFRNGEPVLLQMPPDRPTFTNEVKRLMLERNLTGTEVCRRILMDRRLWSKLNTDAEYQPSRETATAVCIALHLNMEQAQQLLQYAGYTLSCARRQDVVMRYFFVNGIYDVDEINSILYRLGLKCIGNNVRE